MADVASLDADTLERDLWSAAANRVELDVADARYEAMSSALFAGRYAEAARRAHELWRAGVRDVRLVAQLLYGHFLVDGLPGLPWLLHAVSEAFGERWHELGPIKKKREQADAAMRWLGQTLLRDLARHEKARDALWTAWHEDGGALAVRAAREEAERAVTTAAAQLGEGAGVDRLAQLLSWLREREAALAADERAAAEAAAEAALAAAAPTANGAMEVAVPTRAIEGSAALELLLRKLSLFESLITRGDLRKAAVIAHDVQQTLTQFDPLVYLPKLFVRFLSALSRNAQPLERYIGELEDPATRALVRLYQTDLDAFDQL